MDSNGQNISGDLVVEGLSKMLFRCSIFFVLCCLCPQWINGHGFVEPRPSMTKLPSFSGMFPGGHPWHVNILMKNIRWGFEFHGCYPHQVSMISVIYWWILIRSGEKLQKSTYLDWLLQMSEMETSISRISTAREEKHRHHGESHDCTGPRPPRPVWNSVKPGFNQHFPHECVWKITVKTWKKSKSDGRSCFFP